MRVSINSGLRAHLAISLHTLSGLALILIAEAIPVHPAFPRPILLLALFLLLNLGEARLLGIWEQVRTNWSPKKVLYFFIGAIAGVCIACLPWLIGKLCGQPGLSQFDKLSRVSGSTLFVTLVIVSWEELWFRALIYNACAAALDIRYLSILNGLLFMALHLLNPDIDLLQTGPTLWMAGSLLTLMYLRYRNIWLPIGLHSGNNFFQQFIQNGPEVSRFFANDGYLSALILAALFFLFSFPVKKKRGSLDQRLAG